MVVIIPKRTQTGWFIIGRYYTIGGEGGQEAVFTAGFTAYHSTLAGSPLLRELREESPSAILIELTRLPAHGREVGAALRAARATRFIPLVFVGGEAEKVARVLGLSSRQSRDLLNGWVE